MSTTLLQEAEHCRRMAESTGRSISNMILAGDDEQLITKLRKQHALWCQLADELEVYVRAVYDVADDDAQGDLFAATEA